LTRQGTPPKARCVFRVGVVGHRPNRLPQDEARLAALRCTLRTILTDIKAAVSAAAFTPPADALFSSEVPILRAISPLAEGSDRIFAEEALALGYALCCPLPFAQQEFENDFIPPSALEPDSLLHFRALLAEARDGYGLTLFELDGVREHAADAYAAAGRIVLNQCDLLIAVWDGEEPAGPGGTVHTLYEAVAYHVPVIWVDALAPQDWQLVNTAADITEDESGRRRPALSQRKLKEAITHIVQAELRVPAHEKSASMDYFARHRLPVNLAFAWKIFRDLLGAGKLSRPTLAVADFESRDDDGWSAPAAGETSAVSRWVNSCLWPHYAWADGLADLYADADRSAFLLSYLLSAAAVFVALLPMAMNRSDLETSCALLELAILAGILLLLRWARKLRWHERWLECRLLAELIRQLRILLPLGGARPLPRMPAHLAVYGNPSQTWMYWHMGAIARACGIPGAQMTPNYVRDYLTFLAKIVGDTQSGQWGFHALSARRAHHIFSVLRATTVWLVSLTVLAVGLRFFLHIVLDATAPISSGWDRWLLLASAGLPAFGAALEGINNQGEFTRTARRSAAMAGAFEAYAAEIAKMRDKSAPGLAQATAMASTITQIMVDEVTDWRAVFYDRGQ
jgi:hypothetical protein